MIFKTKEKLDENSFSKLNLLFEKVPNLPELDWFKLLAGFLNLEYDDSLIEQDNNYLVLGISQNTNFTFDEIDTFLLSSNSVKYFLNNRTNNILFQKLFNELALYFIATKRSSNIEAFLHLYRIIEKMSIMFPLLYFKQSSNFVQVFQNIKAIVNKDTNDFKFYKNFQKFVFEDESWLQTIIYFNFPFMSQNEQNELKAIYDKVITNYIPESSLINGNKTITMPFGDLISFAVTIRNRYFHMSVSHEFNIEPLNINMNDFFASINENILNWIGVMYYEIFKKLNK